MPDYESFYRAFQWRVPKRFNYARDVIDRWAKQPHRQALLWEDAAGREVRLTFRDVSRLSNRFGNALRALGVAKGDRVIIHLPRIPQWMIAAVGCMKIGAVPIPTTEMMQAGDLEFRINHSGAVAILTTESGAERVDRVIDKCPGLRHRILVGDAVTGEAWPTAGWLDYAQLVDRGAEKMTAENVWAEDPAIMYYTSGTTGHPKAVVHASRAIYSWRQTAYCWIDSKPQDLHWCTADTGWSKFGTSMVFGPWSWGTSLLMYDGPFDPEQRFHFLQKHHATTFCAAPTELRLMVQLNISRYDLSSLRHSVSAGEPLNAEVIERWRQATGLQIYDGYGLTEALMACHNYRCLPVRPGSMGKPLPGYEMAVIDEEGSPTGPDTEGDLAIRTPNPCLMLSHWGEDDALARATRGNWFVTGDRAWMDPDGYFWFVGRGDDVILSAGYRIGPFEIESALATHPAVVESAVVGSPDPIRGEIVKAFVVLAEGQSPSQRLVTALQDHVKRVTAPYKYPREVEFVAELPKTITGKIRRVDLKRQEQTHKGRFAGIEAPRPKPESTKRPRSGDVTAV